MTLGARESSDNGGPGSWRLARAGELVDVALDGEAIRRLKDEQDFAWLDVTRPSEAQIRELGEALGLHALATRAALRFDQEARLDDFGEFEMLVGYLPSDEAAAAPQEFHAILLERLLVTIHHDEIQALDRLLTRFSHSRWIDRPARASFAICEGVAEEFDRAVEQMDTRLDHIEEDMFEEPSDGHLLEIQRVRKQLRALRRTIIPLRDAFGPLGSGWGTAVSKDDERYLRRAYADLSKAERRVEALRDRATAAMDTYLSRVSNRMNVSIERLTIVGTIFLPLTFLASYFGQNFEWLTDRIESGWSFAVLAVVLYGLLVAGALLYFRRARWRG